MPPKSNPAGPGAGSVAALRNRFANMAHTSSKAEVSHVRRLTGYKDGIKTKPGTVRGQTNNTPVSIKADLPGGPSSKDKESSADFKGYISPLASPATSPTTSPAGTFSKASGAAMAAAASSSDSGGKKGKSKSRSRPVADGAFLKPGLASAPVPPRPPSTTTGSSPARVSLSSKNSGKSPSRASTSSKSRKPAAPAIPPTPPLVAPTQPSSPPVPEPPVKASTTPETASSSATTTSPPVGAASSNQSDKRLTGGAAKQRPLSRTSAGTGSGAVGVMGKPRSASTAVEAPPMIPTPPVPDGVVEGEQFLSYSWLNTALHNEGGLVSLINAMNEYHASVEPEDPAMEIEDPLAKDVLVVEKIIRLSRQTLEKYPDQLGPLLTRYLVGTSSDRLKSLIATPLAQSKLTPLRPRVLNKSLDLVLTGPRGARGLALQVVSETYTAVGYSDKKIRVWDTHTGEISVLLVGHKGQVNALTMVPRPDDEDPAVGPQSPVELISGGEDGVVALWTLPESVPTKKYTGHNSPVTGVDLMPGATFIVSSSKDSTLRVWNLSSGETTLTLKGHTGPVTALGVWPTGRRIISGSEDTSLRVWELNESFSGTTKVSVLQEHTAAVVSVCMLEFEGLVLSGAANGELRSWLIDEELSIPMVGHTDAVQGFAQTTYGPVASVSSDLTVRIWDLKNGENFHTMVGHTQAITAVGSMPSGRLVTSSHDGSLRLWDMLAEPDPPAPAHDNVVSAVGVSGNGSVVFSASFDNTIRLWDAATGAVKATLKAHEAEVWTLYYNAAQDTLYSGGWDGKVCVWPAASKAEDSSKPAKSLGSDDNGEVMSVAAPGSLVVTGGSDEDPVLRAWNGATGESAGSSAAHSKCIEEVAVLPNGGFATASADGTVMIWSGESGSLPSAPKTTLKGHSGAVNCVLALKPDGSLVATGGSDHTIRVWETSSGKCIKTLEEHEDSVRALALAADGKILLSGGWDQTIVLWDTASWEVVETHRDWSSWVEDIAVGGDTIAATDGSGVFMWKVSK